MKAKFIWFWLALAVFASFSGADELPTELDVATAVGPKFSAVVTLSEDLPLYSSNRADRVLDLLTAGQRVVVLAMDLHGLKVETRTARGVLRGWISRKRLTKNDPGKEATVAAWYQREMTVAALVASKTAALNLTVDEMERIFGPPTRRSLAVEDQNGGTKERLEWITTEELKLDKTVKGALIVLSGDTSFTQVETARLTVETLNGMVRSIDGSIGEGAVASPQPVLPPVPCPFELVPFSTTDRG